MVTQGSNAFLGRTIVFRAVCGLCLDFNHALIPLINNYYFYFLLLLVGYVSKSLGTAATSGLLYKPQMIDEDDCGAIGRMKIGRGNQSTRRKPAPAPLCPPQISHDQTRARNPGRRGGEPAANRLSYGAAY
jgi:hypothetical protein